MATYMQARVLPVYVCMYVFMYVCMCIYILMTERRRCVYIYITYAHIYIDMYTLYYTHAWGERERGRERESALLLTVNECTEP